MPNPAQEKEFAVIAVTKEGKSVTSVAREYGVARKTIYQWIKQTASGYPAGREHPRAVVWKIKKQLRREVIANPGLTISQLAEKVHSGRHAVHTALKQLGIPIGEDRLKWASRYKPAGRVMDQIKDHIVGEIKSGQKTVTQAAKEAGVSRKTIYQWVKEGGCRDKYVRGANHPRAMGGEVEEAILTAVLANPQASIHSLAKFLKRSSHGIWTVLKKHGLTNEWARQEFALNQIPKIQFQPVLPGVEVREHRVTEQFVPQMAGRAPPSGSFGSWLQIVGISCGVTVFASVFGGLWVRMLVNSGEQSVVGMVFASVALAAGTFFFGYSFKYYITIALVLSFSQGEGLGGSRGLKKGFWRWLLGEAEGIENRNSRVGMKSDLSQIRLEKYPMVSVQIPFYNEKNVAVRALFGAINMDYPEYEVILADDSTDETTQLIGDEMAKYGPREKLIGDGWTLYTVKVREGLVLKHVHRTSRSGFKGGALRLALRMMDPRVEFISVFDADFAPYTDALTSFVKYFKIANNMTEDYTQSHIAAVQGYQWHVLNKSENWITRGVRTEYSGSYVIERAGTELYGGLKQISGSVYMIRRDVLEQVGWGNSITEDFQLTLKLYAAGYKVVYTPYVQALAECVSTTKRLIRQRMRWAEGHSFNVKKMWQWWHWCL